MLYADCIKKLTIKAPLPENAKAVSESSQQPETVKITFCEQCPALLLGLQLAHKMYGIDIVNEPRVWYCDQYKRSIIILALALIVGLIISLSLNTIEFSSIPSPAFPCQNLEAL